MHSRDPLSMSVSASTEHDAQASIALWFRSACFALGLAVTTVVYGVVAIFVLPLPPASRFAIVASWARVNLWWLEKTCKLRPVVEGLENIPRTPTIVFCKHESAWETLYLNLLFRPQVWVLKRELLWIPFFGWGLATLRPIAINRQAGRTAVEQVIQQGKERLQAGYWVVIFPEGTRIAPGKQGRYKMGGAKLAEHTGYPVLPVAHNAGDFWPRNSFRKRPGTIRLVIGPALDTSGLDAKEINERSAAWIEATVSTIRQQTQRA